MSPIRTCIARDWRGGHRLILIEDQAPGKIGVLAGFEWITCEEGDAFFGHEGIGNADQLIQGIMDKAWDAGFRPAGYADVKNETTALRAHLDDLRRIAFHHLGVTS